MEFTWEEKTTLTWCWAILEEEDHTYTLYFGRWGSSNTKLGLVNEEIKRHNGDWRNENHSYELWLWKHIVYLIEPSSTSVRLHSTTEVYRYAAAPVHSQPSSATVHSYLLWYLSFFTSDTSCQYSKYTMEAHWELAFNPFAALGRLTDQNIDKHLSIYSKSVINLIIMERQP